MTRRKKQHDKRRNLGIERLDQRIVLDAAGFIEPVFYEPTPYLSEADTPEGFIPVPGCEQCIVGLETFEDGSLDFGIEIPDGEVIGPDFSTGVDMLTDSVDGDDGVIDGTGQTGDGGYSFFSFGNTVTVNFPILMQSAGLVWTDGSLDVSNVIFEAFDQDGNSLGVVNAGDIADDSFMGTTPEDRFFGVSFGDGRTTGVTSIEITNVGGSGIEIDHIQFANCADCCDIDLELTKTVDATTVQVGDTVNWQVILTNNPENANADATGVVVEDVIPAGLTLLSGVPSSGIFFNNQWTIFDPIAPGDTLTLDLATQVAVGFEGSTIVNVAQVLAADQPDVDSTPGNDDGSQSEDDEDNAQITVAGPAEVIDLELSKTVDSSVVQVGDIVNWQVVVTNNEENANTDATGVSVEDVIPAGLTLLSGVPTSGVFFNNLWTIFEPISPGETLTLNLETQVAAGFEGSTIVNVAQVLTADQDDVDSTPGNDDGSQSEDDEDNAQITVASVDLIDLELTKTVDSSVVQVGEIVNWQVVLTNNEDNANTDATGVVVEDIIPPGLTLLSGLPTNGIFLNNQWTIFDPVAPGDTLTLNLETQVEAGFAGSTIVNVAQVLAADQPDVDSTPGNDDGTQSEDDEDNAQITVAGVVEGLMLSGFSYVDVNDDGIFQDVELPLMGVEIQLMGTDNAGNEVSLATFTNVDGLYKFNDLSPGTYMVSQVQPIQFVDGQDTLGNLGGDDTVNDKFTVTLNDDAEEYNFGELGLRPEFVGKRLYLTSTPYSEWEFIDVREFSIWHSFNIEHASFLDINAALLDGDVLFTVLNENMEVVAERGAGVLSSEADAVVLDESGTYYLEISGEGEIETLSLEITAPEVTQDGSKVTAVATPGDDVVVLSLGSETHILNISGIEYTFAASEVNEFHVGSFGGYDSITVHGTTLDDTAHVLESRGQFDSSAYSVDTYTFENTTFVSGGGDDYVQIFGSNGDDRFAGLPQDSTLTTPENVIHILGVDRVDAYGRNGYDYASVYGSHGDDLYYARDEYALMQGEGIMNYTKGFERVDAFGRGGTDSAQLFDSEGNDQFVSMPSFAYLIGNNRTSYTKGFERVDAISTLGGNDKAVFLDGADIFESFISRLDQAYMTDGSYLHYANNFKTIRATSTGGIDTAQILDLKTGDEFHAHDDIAALLSGSRDDEVKGFDLVMVAAEDEEAPSAYISDVDYLLSENVNWI